MHQNTFKYELNNSTANNAEIYIYGYIGEWEEVDYPRFQKMFRDSLAKYKELTIRIHSGGGSVSEGLAIYDLIRGSETKVTVVVEGMAASMASVIALAGDTIKMTENAFFMMHAVTGGAWGNKAELIARAEQMGQCETRLQTIYKERTTADEATIQDWFTNGKDNWLDSNQCLDIKVCDEVIKPTKTRNIDTKNIVNKTPEYAWAEMLKGLQNRQNTDINKHTDNMNKQQLVASLIAMGLAGDLTASSDDAAVQKQLETVFAKAKEADQFKNELKTFKEAQAKVLINAAVKDGKIQANEKEEWLRDATDKYELVAKSLARMSGKPDLNGRTKRGTPPVDTGRHELFNGREDWTFADWQNKAPKDLERVEDEAPEEFENLFNQQYDK